MSRHLTTDGALLDSLATNQRNEAQAWTIDTFNTSERNLLFNQGADYLNGYERFKEQSITGYSLNTGTGFETFVVALLMHGPTPLVVLARHRGMEQGNIATTLPTRGTDPWPGTILNFNNNHLPQLPLFYVENGNRFWRDQAGWAFGIHHPRFA